MTHQRKKLWPFRKWGNWKASVCVHRAYGWCWSQWSLLHHICFQLKSLKWWRKLIFWYLEVSIVNSYILYSRHKALMRVKQISHVKCPWALAENLIGDRCAQPKKAVTPADSKERRETKYSTSLPLPLWLKETKTALYAEIRRSRVPEKKHISIVRPV
jgi:hypothetical protein